MIISLARRRLVADSLGFGCLEPMNAQAGRGVLALGRKIGIGYIERRWHEPQIRGGILGECKSNDSAGGITRSGEHSRGAGTVNGRGRVRALEHEAGEVLLVVVRIHLSFGVLLLLLLLHICTQILLVHLVVVLVVCIDTGNSLLEPVVVHHGVVIEVLVVLVECGVSGV